MKDLIRGAIFSIVIDEVAKKEELGTIEVYEGIMSAALSAIGSIANMVGDDPKETVERICTETYYQIKRKEE